VIHHASVGSSGLARSRIFYQAVIPPLGYRLVSEDEQSLDYGSAVFEFSVERPLDGRPATGGNGTHIAFEARSRADVDTFHREGLAHGGRDAGAPGLRPDYDANYYGAFLFDPDGNKIEAVTFSAT
jgi:catechol 2,3-dioxygenase-like lactoylglutathione lyase family enzyme